MCPVQSISIEARIMKQYAEQQFAAVNKYLNCK